jgi:hypothetical protein
MVNFLVKRRSEQNPGTGAAPAWQTGTQERRHPSISHLPHSGKGMPQWYNAAVLDAEEGL